MIETQKQELLFYLFSVGASDLHAEVKQLDSADIEQQGKTFYYTYYATIERLTDIQRIRRATKNIDVSIRYRLAEHWYDSRTGKIQRTWYNACKNTEATHIEVVIRKRQLEKHILTEYKRLKQYHFEQYELYKYKLNTRTR